MKSNRSWTWCDTTRLWEVSGVVAASTGISLDLNPAIEAHSAAEGLNLPHFSEEAIEMAAMGRLRNVKLQKHLSRCLKCTARVVEHRAWIEALMCAVPIRLHPSDVLTVKKSGFSQRRPQS